MKTPICLLVMCVAVDCAMDASEVNKLKEIIKNLKSVKIDFAEVRKEMDRFDECNVMCVNNRKMKQVPKIGEIVHFQLWKTHHAYQHHLNGGVLSSDNDRNDARVRLRRQFYKTKNYTMVHHT